jgi:hypothetical protein
MTFTLTPLRYSFDKAHHSAASRAGTFRCLLAVLLVLACLLFNHSAHANRVALIMSNSAYDAKLGALVNPHRDAELMQNTLQQLGFKVSALRDGTLKQMQYAMADFTTAATGADLAFIYYSGHGAQADGNSYLIPIGAQLSSQAHYELEALPLEKVLKSLTFARPKNAVIVLDSCRDNPLAFTKSIGDKGMGRLPEFDRILIAQAAPQGRTTPDNGLYARVLSQTLLKPNLSLVNAFFETNASIRKQTAGGQVPRISEVTIDHELVLRTNGDRPAIAANAAVNQPLFVPTPAPNQFVDGYEILAGGAEVKDPKTGLIWQRCSVGKVWNGSTCAGDAKGFSFDEAQRLSNNGWRVPTVRELHSIVWCSSGKTMRRADPEDGGGAIKHWCDGQYQQPTIKLATFPAAPSDFFWTSSPYAGGSSNAWGVNFDGGYVDYYGRGSASRVRLVR